MGFSGSCGKSIVLPYFPQYFCIVEETRQRRNGLVLLKPLRAFILYVYSDYESGTAGRDLRCAESEK